ncbi:MAG: membrane protein insertion efficiency factor YidD [bacterium]
MLQIIILKIIKIYQLVVSPFLGGNCRFYPSCSGYASQAISKHGAAKGGWMAMKRILKCNQWIP